MAHNEITAFQKTTEILNTENENAVFVQFHGFAKNTKDPFVIMSNGTRETPFLDYISQLKTELEFIDDSLTYKIAHIDTTWNRLVGFTNTQGRYLNESIDPCSISAQNTSGKFIHLEQEKSRLRQDSTGWNKIKIALENIFNCDSILSSIKEKRSPIFYFYPNPVKGNEVFILLYGFKLRS